MRQLPGFENNQHPHHLCRLNKAIYGLKQAPRAWFSRLSLKLYELGFSASKADTSLFIYSEGDTVIYILVYVDDIIILSSSDHAVIMLIQNLKADFPIKGLGDLNYFLGVSIRKTENEGLILSQHNYIRDLLKKYNMTDYKGVATPTTVFEKLSRTEGTPLSNSDIGRYRSTVGALQYLTITRPDIAFSVNKVFQFLHSPIDIHWGAVKRIFRYL